MKPVIGIFISALCLFPATQAFSQQGNGGAAAGAALLDDLERPCAKGQSPCTVASARMVADLSAKTGAGEDQAIRQIAIQLAELETASISGCQSGAAQSLWVGTAMMGLSEVAAAKGLAQLSTDLQGAGEAIAACYALHLHLDGGEPFILPPDRPASPT